MESVKYRFSDLATVIDGVHAVFDQFAKDETNLPSFDDETLHRTKLAVHEWVANLVQHANFTGRVPEITLDFWSDGGNIECLIEDNSDGFDLDSHLLLCQDVLDAYPERGMGLLMLQACAKNLYYGTIGDGRNRLKFSVSANGDPWLNIPF